MKIAIIGYGKIAEDQHRPSIENDPDFELAAVVSRGGKGPEGPRCFTSHEDLLAEADAFDAVSLTTPPNVRYEIARACLASGLHVMLEKPPGISLGEVDELERLAAEKKLTLFATWHAQANAAVEEAQRRLAGQRIRSMHISWKEDVRKWHPGQQWIWAPGGFGVFDPGINALSIATRIMPSTLLMRQASLSFPENRQAPIAAELVMASPASEGPITADFDWRQEGGEEWTITVETDGGSLALHDGGSRLLVDGDEVATHNAGEYPTLYRRFAELIRSGQSDVDLEPLRLTADAFLLGERKQVSAFID